MLRRLINRYVSRQISRLRFSRLGKVSTLWSLILPQILTFICSSRNENFKTLAILIEFLHDNLRSNLWISVPSPLFPCNVVLET